MKFRSTRDNSQDYTARQAVLSGLAPDGGLFLPTEIPSLNASFLGTLSSRSLVEIGQEISRLFFEDIPESTLATLVSEALSFPTPLIPLSLGDGPSLYSLELFHGPTCAFKDFGARFMARLMSWYNKDENTPLTILVATSGDTGSAVANGFLGVEGISVVLLYPQGKVSHIQEQQLTTCGHNITAVEVAGTFDDCQRLVKEAFSNKELLTKRRLSSANSINISRLIPQSFYYFSACAELSSQLLPAIFSVPSGNFGNLTAGIFAKRMGAPIKRFIAATNVNDIVPAYLHTGVYSPRPSLHTLSNAMDVGAPSNFERLQSLFHNSLDEFQEVLTGQSFTDEETLSCMSDVYNESGYLLDPHGAVGLLGLQASLQEEEKETHGAIFLETAHPAKFASAVETATGQTPTLPTKLQACLEKEKKSVLLARPELEGLWEIILSMTQ